MADVTYTVDGLAPTLARLDDLKRAVADRILAKALQSAMRPVARTAKALAPRSDPHAEPGLVPGLLRKAITAPKRWRRAGRGKVEVVIGIKSLKTPKRRGEGFQDPRRYAHLVENGHGGPHPAGPKAFLRPAWDQHVSGMPAAVAVSVANEIDKLMKSGKFQRYLK